MCISCHLNLSERAGLWRCARPHRQPFGVVLGLSRFLAVSTAKERPIDLKPLCRTGFVVPPRGRFVVWANGGQRLGGCGAGAGAVRASAGVRCGTRIGPAGRPRPLGLGIRSQPAIGIGRSGDPDSLLGILVARPPTHNARPLAKIVGWPQPANLQFFIS